MIKLFTIKILLLSILLFLARVDFSNSAMYYIPDNFFKQKLILLGYSSCITGDSIDSSCPLVAATSTLNINNSNIGDLTGIAAFTSLDTLYCKDNDFLYMTTPIVLPSTLIYLDVYGSNAGGHLLTLPSSLKYLDCTFLNALQLPPLPAGLLTLICPASSITSLPVLPANLKILKCQSITNLTTIPALPSSLIEMDCSQDDINSLPNLPTGLKILDCKINNLSVLPTLSDSLLVLICYLNQIVSLPSLPPNLTTLSCNGNQLTSLPFLPNNINYIDATDNLLASFPNFPSSIVQCYLNRNLLTTLPIITSTYNMYLDCSFNRLTSIPAINNIASLNVSYNQLTALPSLPQGIGELNVENNFISCLPVLPSSLQRLYGAAAGYTCIPNLPPLIYVLTGPSNICNSPCSDMPVISGKVFNDDNFNLVQDSTEVGHPNLMMQVQPGNYYFQTDQSGHYSIAVDDSISYLITPFSIPYYTNVPISISTNNLSTGEKDSLNDFALQPSGIVPDLNISLTGLLQVRIGMDDNYYIRLTNNGTINQAAALKHVPDSQLNFISSVPPPDSINGDTLIWNNISLTPGQFKQFTIKYHADNAISLGTSLVSYAEAISLLTDITPVDNSDTLYQTAGNTSTSNFKTVLPSGDINTSQIAAGQWMEYTIWFQNTGTSAINYLEVSDTLDNNLNLSTIQIISSSHLFTFAIQQQIANFRFDYINLPDSGTNEAGSHGFVRFRILADNNLTAGQTIQNIAKIYFGLNDTTATNTVITNIVLPTNVNQINSDDGGISIYPNPCNGIFYINDLNKNGNLLITIYDILGKSVFEKRLNGVKNLKVDLTGLNINEGVYIVSIVGGQFEIRKKMVVGDVK